MKIAKLQLFQQRTCSRFCKYCKKIFVTSKQKCCQNTRKTKFARNTMYGPFHLTCIMINTEIPEHYERSQRALKINTHGDWLDVAARVFTRILYFLVLVT